MPKSGILLLGATHYMDSMQNGEPVLNLKGSGRANCNPFPLNHALCMPSPALSDVSGLFHREMVAWHACCIKKKESNPF